MTTFLPTKASVIIEGNSVSQGNYTDGTGTFNAKYDSLLYCNANAQINNNVFSGITSDVTKNLVKLENCSCNVYNNEFIRGASAVNSYILSTGIYDHRIINNVFDSADCGNIIFDEIIVKGITTSTAYDQNTNQICYKQIRTGQHVGSDVAFPAFASGPVGSSLSMGVPYFFTQYDIPKAYDVFAVFSGSGGGDNTIKIRINFNLDQYLPLKVKVLGCVFSFACKGQIELSSANSTVSMNLARTLSNTFNTNSGFSSLSGSLADVADKLDAVDGYGLDTSHEVTSNTVTFNGSSAVPGTNTGYVYIDVSDIGGVNPYITGSGFDNNIHVTMNLVQTKNSFATNFFNSFIVKYKYV